MLNGAGIHGQGHFFLGLGSGIWLATPVVLLLLYYEPRLFFSISPSIGWKIEIGTQNRWVIMPSITTRILMNHDFPVIKLGFSVGYRF